MAGAGYKLFNTGDVLTAAQVNTYLQEQAVMRFANSTARTTALSGVLAEGMVSYLDDTNSVEVYNGSAWVSIGSTGDITGVTAGTGISGGGTSGDVTITNSMATAIDAKGDLIVGTGADTFSRLAVSATDGHVLKVKASTSTGLEWGAASSGALTKISSTTFSSVATQTFDNVFSSSYDTYLIQIPNFSAATAADDLRLRWRYSTNTETGNTYSGFRQRIDYGGNETITGYITSYAELAINCGSAAEPSAGWFWVNMLGGSSTRMYLFGNFWEENTGAGNNFQFDNAQARTYTGFQLFSSNTNISGTVVIYGLEK